jgi:hypothetical protein
MATVGDTLDRSSSFTGLYERGADGRLHQVAGELTTGPTVGGQVIVATVPMATGALIQGHTARSVAASTTCRGAQCGGGTVIINSPTALASAVSDSTANSDVAILPCMIQGTCVVE